MTFWDQGDILKPKNSKSVTFTLKGGFRTFWSRLAHSAAPRAQLSRQREKMPNEATN